MTNNSNMKNIFLKFIYWVLAKLARRVIVRHQPFVIAITGSVGKSTTKEAIYAVLADEYGEKVRKNYGSLNAELGIPLTILGYEKLPNKLLWLPFLVGAYFRSNVSNYPKYLVLEWGVEHKGDISYFSNIVRPDIAVITAITPVHLVNFRDFDQLKEEKLSIIKAMKDGSKLFVNADDDNLACLNNENLIGIGVKNRKAKYCAENIHITLIGTKYRIETVGQKISIDSKFLGQHSVYAQLFAFAIGQEMGIQSLKIKKSLEKISPLPGRMNLIVGKDDVTIIDDTYNANPASVMAALDTLSEIETKSRKVAIIGNMNEQGENEKEAHAWIGEYAKGKCDLAVFVGPNAISMISSYGDEDSSLQFSSRKDLIENLDKVVRSGDIVLIKASQNGNFFEEVVKALMLDQDKAGQLLVRQSRFWLRKK